MDKPSLGDRLRYRFDNWMSRGTAALMALLGIATVAFVVVLGLIAWVVLLLIGDEENLGDDPAGPIDMIWRSLMRTLDPGTMGADEGWGFRLVMLVVTVGGLIIVASLIGIVSGAFDAKVAELRKGRSRVLESEHTLILGWSGKVFPVVAEICIANRSRPKSAIVVLADKDKVEMEDALRAEVPDIGKTRIIVRSGDPMNLSDLEIANPHSARSIIVLADDQSEDPDSEVIKTTLAVTNNPNRKSGKYHIVGELRDPANLEAARLVGKGEAHWILSAETISRITVQTCRQSGLSVVYSELLDFDGAEMYFTEQPALVGGTFLEAQLAFPDSSLGGIARGADIRLNPPAGTRIEPGDRLIVIADDDRSIRLGEPGVPDMTLVASPAAADEGPETTLVLGWNRTLPLILAGLDQYSVPRSRVRVVADVEAPDIDRYPNLEVSFQRADPTNRATLDALYAHEFDHIIVLARKDDLAPQRADARTLVILLHLREIAAQHGRHLGVVSEMLDDRNRELAEVTQADDFIVSDRLISLLLSQTSENAALTEVFAELFASDGAEIYLRPAGDYIRPGESADFTTVVAAASARGETAIGYRRHVDARDAAKLYGVTLNPVKAQRVAFQPDDRIIVLAAA